MGKNFEKFFFGPEKNFGPFPREIRQKIIKKRPKKNFWDQGELTCVLQIKITLFYCKMMNSVMALEFWAPKVIFWCNFRRIFVQKLVKMVNFGELWLNLVIWSLFRLRRSLDYPFPWTTSWKMMREAHLKDSRHKNCAFGL